MRRLRPGSGVVDRRDVDVDEMEDWEGDAGATFGATEDDGAAKGADTEDEDSPVSIASGTEESGADRGAISSSMSVPPKMASSTFSAALTAVGILEETSVEVATTIAGGSLLPASSPWRKKRNKNIILECLFL